jgi:peptidoglycan hydrolase-like protein with peptidoglycan-binding domain
VTYRAPILAIMLVLAASWTNAATAAVREPIRQGDTGQRVADLQWRLLGHNHYGLQLRSSRPTGWYGPPTAAQVRRAKYRLGWPIAHVLSADGARAGAYFRDIFAGRRTRPYAFRAKAGARQSAATANACSRRIVGIANTYVGVRESPVGSNTGPQVRVFQASTGAYGAAWCVSFVQHVLIRSGYGTIADRSAGVFYVLEYARRRGWTRSRPRPGNLAAFRTWQGHVGIVKSVSSSGFVTVEGNASDSVLERFHPFGSRPVTFIALPRCS